MNRTCIKIECGPLQRHGPTCLEIGSAGALLRAAALFAVLAFAAACNRPPSAQNASGAGKPAAGTAAAGSNEAPIPKLVTENGRHALLVDGEPFLILGAQV